MSQRLRRYLLAFQDWNTLIDLLCIFPCPCVRKTCHADRLTLHSSIAYHSRFTLKGCSTSHSPVNRSRDGYQKQPPNVSSQRLYDILTYTLTVFLALSPLASRSIAHIYDSSAIRPSNAFFPPISFSSGERKEAAREETGGATGASRAYAGEFHPPPTHPAPIRVTAKKGPHPSVDIRADRLRCLTTRRTHGPRRLF